ncbi:antA/AntB antirepressor family protein [Microvirga zambiensis]|uniref:antA/AntB antirepressor family protein n=1 Tax=Microvirga zambiensis TaxID=1402137 RepID=UPI0019201A5C|nr:antA/AntB antirepressor family protein [Microvirga zambiensis]
MTDDTDNQFPIVREGAIGGNIIQTVNARDLHRFLEVGRDYTTWIKDRIASYGFEQDVDFVVIEAAPQNGGAGNRGVKTEYFLSLDMGKELGMVERNEKGRQIRQYFLECERRAKANPMAAALNDPEYLRKALLINVEKVIALEGQVAEAKPKVEFYDQFANADGVYGLQNAGRVLKQPPNKFIDSLKRKYLFYQGGALVPYRTYVERGLFTVKMEMVEDKARYRTFVTPKGIQFFADQLGLN